MWKSIECQVTGRWVHWKILWSHWKLWLRGRLVHVHKVHVHTRGWYGHLHTHGHTHHLWGSVPGPLILTAHLVPEELGIANCESWSYILSRITVTWIQKILRRTVGIYGVHVPLPLIHEVHHLLHVHLMKSKHILRNPTWNLRWGDWLGRVFRILSLFLFLILVHNSKETE